MKSLLTLLLVAGTAAAAEERHVYRLDFAIVESDAVKTTYTLNLGEHSVGEIKMGSNVALAGKGGTMRTDIGLTLRASYTLVGEDLLVDDDVEITSVKDAQTFRKMSVKGNALIQPSKPALVASLEDPVSHKQIQVTVTATKLR
jgi:hypothetical protein